MTGATEDQGLVARAKRGDREAFGDLVVRHEGAMLAIARAYFASEADAEDAVQEAFVRAYRRLDQLAFENRFAAWVARITKNVCIDILRARTDKMSLADFASTVQFHKRVGPVQLTPGALASKGEEADMLRAAIGSLPEAQRVILMLRYTEEMSYDEMATYLDIPPSTVRWRLHAAKEALRRALRSLTPDRD
jgi:RNA polymerase sigma-70 factor (ECF subfamily)